MSQDHPDSIQAQEEEEIVIDEISESETTDTDSQNSSDENNADDDQEVMDISGDEEDDEYYDDEDDDEEDEYELEEIDDDSDETDTDSGQVSTSSKRKHSKITTTTTDDGPSSTTVDDEEEPESDKPDANEMIDSFEKIKDSLAEMGSGRAFQALLTPFVGGLLTELDKLYATFEETVEANGNLFADSKAFKDAHQRMSSSVIKLESVVSSSSDVNGVSSSNEIVEVKDEIKEEPEDDGLVTVLGIKTKKSTDCNNCSEQCLCEDSDNNSRKSGGSRKSAGGRKSKSVK